MGADLRYIIGTARLITLISQAILSITICCLLHDHLIGSCQMFVYFLHFYLSIICAACLFLRMNLIVFEERPVSLSWHLICVFTTNVFIFSSFVCASANAEDGGGFTRLEAIAVLCAISWGVHLSHLTSVSLLALVHENTQVNADGMYIPLTHGLDEEDVPYTEPISIACR